MGMDLVDMQFRLEREFGVAPTNDDLEELARGYKPFDIRVGDLYVRMGNLCRSQWLPFPGDSWPRFQRILSEVTGVDAKDIQTDLLLVRDLGVE